jgi:iron complex transport system ATP-binding protein
MINVQQVSYTIEKKNLVQNVSFKVLPGEFTVIMGPNGAGKSTLLKMMSAALKPSSGEILWKGKKITDYPLDELAKQRAVLSQHYDISFPLTAKEIVMMGRYPYFKADPHAADHAMVDFQIERLSVSALGDRNYQSLSGGEAQKIQMCRVLSQLGSAEAGNEKLLLLDEPVSHVDIKYQHQLLALAKETSQQNVAVVAVLHDINLALKYADTIHFMKNAKLIKTLEKNETLEAGLLKEVFDISAAVYPLPDGSGNFVAFN